MFTWLINLIAKLDSAFEQRLRRASGLDQAQHSLATPVIPALDEADAEGNEISNVALGVNVGESSATKSALSDLSADLPPPPVLRPQPAPKPTAYEDDEEEGTIVNL